MADTNINASTNTSTASIVSDFSVTPKTSDNSNTDELTITFPEFTKYYGYYRTIPELKKTIDTLATWTVGKGYIVEDAATEIILKSLQGNGKDTFDKIIFNMFVSSVFNGDSFAEIITTDNDTLVNLKPLNPQKMAVIYDDKGLIKRYEYYNGTGIKKLQKEKIFHIQNDRVIDEPRGVSVVEACKWVIDARNEAMSDKRRVHHRSTIRIMEVDSDDRATLTALATQYGQAIKNGEVLIVPKGNVDFPDAPINYLDTLEWIKYLESFFYVACGVPKSVVNPEGFTEAASKVGYVSFDPVYSRYQMALENAIFNQLGIIIKFNRPSSLTQNLQSDEEKNTGQLMMQPNETQMEFNGGGQ